MLLKLDEVIKCILLFIINTTSFLSVLFCYLALDYQMTNLLYSALSTFCFAHNRAILSIKPYLDWGWGGLNQHTPGLQKVFFQTCAKYVSSQLGAKTKHFGCHRRPCVRVLNATSLLSMPFYYLAFLVRSISSL